MNEGHRHVLVIGAGIVGLMTAYFLRRDGHTVTVVDRNAEPGLETSRANGAQLSYSFVAPLADPAVLPKLPSWLMDRDAPLNFRLRADPAQWRWGLAFLKACRRETVHRTTRDMLELGLASRALLREMVAREGYAFDFSSTGKLLVYQDHAAYALACRQLQMRDATTGGQRILSRRDCLEMEPALQAGGHGIVGGIFMPEEDAGDCLKLCVQMHRQLSAAPHNVTFRFNTEVRGFRFSGQQVVGLETDGPSLSADAYVIANGLGAQKLGLAAGFNPMIHPLKGYSLTYELTEKSRAPARSVSDIHRKVVYARLGNRLRVAGMVDIGDRDPGVTARRIDLLKSQVNALLPELAPAAQPKVWAGMRPARPDSTPLIGATPCGNLWINAGHGMLGFTLAAGSARLLADRLAGRPCAVQRHAFALH